MPIVKQYAHRIKSIPTNIYFFLLSTQHISSIKSLFPMSIQVEVTVILHSILTACNFSVNLLLWYGSWCAVLPGPIVIRPNTMVLPDEPPSTITFTIWQLHLIWGQQQLTADTSLNLNRRCIWLFSCSSPPLTESLSPPHGESLCPNLWTQQVKGHYLHVKGWVRTLGRLMYVTMHVSHKCKLTAIKDYKTVYHHVDNKGSIKGSLPGSCLCPLCCCWCSSAG